MAGYNGIKILRGNSGSLSGKGDLLEGQPLYIKDKNYLTVGGGTNGARINQSPITVRELIGYADDNNGITGSINNSYSISPNVTSNGLDIYSNQPLDISSNANINISGAADVNIASPAAVYINVTNASNSLSYSRLTLSESGQSTLIGSAININSSTDLTLESREGDVWVNVGNADPRGVLRVSSRNISLDDETVSLKVNSQIELHAGSDNDNSGLSITDTSVALGIFPRTDGNNAGSAELNLYSIGNVCMQGTTTNVVGVNLTASAFYLNLCASRLNIYPVESYPPITSMLINVGTSAVPTDTRLYGNFRTYGNITASGSIYVNSNYYGSGTQLQNLDGILRNIDQRLDAMGFKEASIQISNSDYIDASSTHIYQSGTGVYGDVTLKVPTMRGASFNDEIAIATVQNIPDILDYSVTLAVANRTFSDPSSHSNVVFILRHNTLYAQRNIHLAAATTAAAWQSSGGFFADSTTSLNGSW